MPRQPVQRSYVTDHRNQETGEYEYVIVLTDGRAIYCMPGESDVLCASEDDALDLCLGTPKVDRLTDWRAGYPIPHRGKEA